MTMGIMILCALAYFTIVFISPRYDLQRRGFIPCTEKLADSVEKCGRNNILCTLGAIWTDNMCNISVIWQGLNKWVRGEQSTPWSNYIFEPEIATEPAENNEELQKFYQENPNLYQDMQELKRLNKEQEENDYQNRAPSVGFE